MRRPLRYLERWQTRKRQRGAIAWLRSIAVYYGGLDSAASAAATERIAAALGMIRQFDPRRADRLEKDQIGIVLAPGLGGNRYSEGTNTIQLDVGLVMQRSVASLATTLVHEATHARFALAGVYYNRSNARRMEARCVEEEIAFVERLPHTSDAEYVQWVAARRAQLEHPWWTRRGRLRALAATFERDGAAPWLVRLTRTLAGDRTAPTRSD